MSVRAIEDGFPVGAISRLAERESWRKEIYRPVYYVHKWWARRLGSVFRAIILASCAPAGEDIESLFYQPVQFPDMVVFDPFMGSGTTIGEALKLGCRAIGRDINPVSVGMVTAALQEYPRDAVLRTFRDLEASVAAQILSFYKTELPGGGTGDVLYYFWVKVVPCPHCGRPVELFKSRVFARHANPRQHPQARSLCPQCGHVNDIRYDDRSASCSHCAAVYNPQVGPVQGANVTCPACHRRFKVIEAVRRSGVPPDHKLFAKLVLTPAGEKQYLPTDEQDMASYHRAEAMLPELGQYVPQERIRPGYNTNQILNYHYERWHQMFNARQLVSIGLLAREIRSIADPRLRLLFAFLLSGALEFNNMFCSFKGEGTGAVRHLFSHHILKPELVPIEANLWGTPRSSGSFSTLFRSRILKALDYKAHPFELELVRTNGALRSKKVFGLSRPLNTPIVRTYAEFAQSTSVYLSCGDSAHTDLPDGAVDLVITDPPFFDNVHYSQLADFFHVWLRVMLEDHPDFVQPSTRSSGEVQDTDAEPFAAKLAAVLRECHRVLADSGLLVFTYHHTRIEGWAAIYRALRQAGFYIVYAQPVKSEMSVSVPIRQARSPARFDLILVCRKAPPTGSPADLHDFDLSACLAEAEAMILDLKRHGVAVNAGDAKVILMGTVLARLAAFDDLGEEIRQIYRLESQLDGLTEQVLIKTQPSILSLADQRLPEDALPVSHQLALWPEGA